MIATANAWYEEQKCAAACALLTGPAACWLDTFTVTSWKEFVKGIKQRFQDDPEKALHKLMTIQQQTYEGVEDYVDRYKILLAICDDSGNKLPISCQLMFFIDGLWADVCMKVKNRRPIDLHGAISDAKYFASKLDAQDADVDDDDD